MRRMDNKTEHDSKTGHLLGCATTLLQLPEYEECFFSLTYQPFEDEDESTSEWWSADLVRDGDTVCEGRGQTALAAIRALITKAEGTKGLTGFP